MSEHRLGVAFAIVLLGPAHGLAAESNQSAPHPTVVEAFASQIPARFAGVLPCADCEGIRYDIDIRADDVYFLRRTYLGTNAAGSVDEIGQWSITADAQLRLLRANADLSELYSIADAAALVKLDRNGKRIDSHLNYTLTRAPDYAPLEPRLRLSGMYRHMAGAGTFEECTTGLRLPVVTEGANAALESAYVRVRSAPRAPVFARVEGCIVNRGGSEDEDLRSSLLVDTFDALSPNESCGARGVTHELTGTRWVLVRLRDETVMPEADAREPFVAFESGNVTGFDGCNRLLGGYEVSGQQITITRLATTLMACANQSVTSTLGAALDASVRFRIDGPHLEMFDAADVLQARFESRNL